MNNIPQGFEISTSCKNCYFAEYKDNTQTGCCLDRLEKYKNINAEVIEAYDDDKEFYVIQDKICVYYRNHEFIEELGLSDSEDILRTIKSELHAPYHLILFFRENDTQADLEKCIQGASNQKIKPKVFTVINKFNRHVEASKIMEIVNHYGFDYWRIQNAANLEFEWDRDLIDLSYDSTKKHKYLFYTVFETLQGIPFSFSEEIHDSMYEDLQVFSCLLPNKNENGLTVLRIAQEKYSGSSFGIKVEEKIKFYDDDSHLIKKVEDLCPSLKI
jgi:hypothetical protein